MADEGEKERIAEIVSNILESRLSLIEEKLQKQEELINGLTQTVTEISAKLEKSPTPAARPAPTGAGSRLPGPSTARPVTAPAKPAPEETKKPAGLDAAAKAEE